MRKIIIYLLCTCFVSTFCKKEISYFPDDVNVGQGESHAHADKNFILPQKDRKIIAFINKEPIYLDELEDEIKSGRFGGSKELLLDELISFKTVIQERNKMQGDVCRVSSTLRTEATEFLNLLYPPEIICKDLSETRKYRMYEKLLGRKIPFHSSYNAPEVKTKVFEFVCKAEIKKIKSQYIKDLRKFARIEINKELMDEIQ